MIGLENDNYNTRRRAGATLPVVLAWFLFVCVPSSLSARASAVSFEDAVSPANELRISQPVSQSVTASTPLHFWFRSERNFVFKLAVQQRDMSLRVTVVRPDGIAIVERTTPVSGTTSIVAVTNLAGTYSITVTPLQMDGRARQFSIGLAEVSPFRTRESAELSASAGLEAGDELSSHWTLSSLDEALLRYRRSENEWRRAGDLEEASSALVREGDVHAIRGQFKAALTSYQAALQLLPGGINLERRIDILNAIATLSLAYTELEEARKNADEANNLSVSISYDEGRGRALTALGGVEYYRSNHAASQTYLDQAMSIWAKTPDRQGEAFTWMNLSYLHSGNSQHASAYADLTRALKISQSIDDEFAEARAVIGIGNYYVRVDEMAQARDSFNASLKLLAKMGSVTLEAIVLDDFGYYLENVGDPSSFGLYKKAALIAEHAEHPLLYSNVLSDLCRASIAEGKPSQALQYAERERKLSVGLHHAVMISQSLRDIGEAYMASGNVNLALKFFTDGMDEKLVGLNAAEQVNSKIEFARALERLGRVPEALDAYREAAAISQSVGSNRAEADARYRIAHLEAAGGHFDLALPEIEKSVSLVESLRTKVSADDTRILWFASFHSIYTLCIDVLMQLSSQKGDEGMARKAFQIAELSIARSFVELMHGAQVEKGNGEDLVREDASLRRLLAEKNGEESRLLGNGSPDAEAMRKIASEISDLHDREVEIQSLLRTRDPEYFQMQVDPLPINKVQSLIGEEDIVLEYSLGSSHSYLWAISKTGFLSYALPPEDEIETLVRRFRQAVVSPGLGAERVVSPSTGDRENEERLAQDLGGMLLAPVPNLDRFKRVIVVADGALQYLPFGVLITKPRDHDSAAKLARVADDHEVTNLPSMTALSVLRSRRNLNGPATKGLLMFADPVFESDDPRIDMANYKTPQKSSSTKPEVAADVEGYGSGPLQHFPRLPGSREEAAAIAEIAPDHGADILLGFDANRRRAESQDIQNYRFIHFATHSVFDDEHPESSGVILSLFDHSGKPEDGFLRLRDIYGLKLSADLVVLSACDTALGKNIKGEGIVGLTRGFMFAGTPRVVATLWRVDDDATSEFMKWFYNGIFQKQESPATALREAQIEMRKQARWRAPYYWGGFVIEGEWR